MAIAGVGCLIAGEAITQTSTKKIEANEFILKDMSGKVRAALRIGEHGTGSVSWSGPQLVMFDAKGTARATLGYERRADGSGEHVQFKFFDEKGSRQFSVSTVSENGQVDIDLFHEAGSRVRIGVHPRQAEVLVAREREASLGSASIFANTRARGLAVVGEYSPDPSADEKPEIYLCTDRGKVQLELFDKQGNAVFSKP